MHGKKIRLRCRKKFIGFDDSKKNILDFIESNVDVDFNNESFLFHLYKLVSDCKESKENILKYFKYYLENPKRSSVRSIETYCGLYGDELGFFKFNEGCRHISENAFYEHLYPQYWIDKGFSYDEAIHHINSRKTKAINSLRKSFALSNNRTSTQLQYWIDKGYSDNIAREKLSERQTTFSLQKCVDKYGESDGTKKWQDRQIKWQNTLKSKSSEDIRKINKFC